MSTILVVATTDDGYSETGSGWTTYGSLGYDGGPFNYDSTNGDTATFTFALPEAGTWKVAITFNPNAARPPALGVVVNDDGSPLLSTTIDETIAPTDFTYNTSAFLWLSADGLVFATTTATVVLTVPATGTAVAAADAVYFELVDGLSLTAGTASTASNTSSSVSIAIATNSGGTSPYSNQLQRSPHGADTFSNVGSPVSGATATLTDGTVAASTAYDYQVVVTDSAEATATSNLLAVTTPAAAAAAAPSAGGAVAGPAEDRGQLRAAQTGASADPDRPQPWKALSRGWKKEKRSHGDAEEMEE